MLKRKLCKIFEDEYPFNSLNVGQSFADKYFKGL